MKRKRLRTAADLRLLRGRTANPRSPRRCRPRKERLLLDQSQFLLDQSQFLLASTAQLENTDTIGQLRCVAVPQQCPKHSRSSRRAFSETIQTVALNDERRQSSR
jgi:hypothetical protein